MDQTAAADRHRDPAVVARVTTLAAQLLTRHGIDFTTARRARGYSNLTWLAGGLAVRIAAEAGPGDLLREARLAVLLPPEVGYPRVIDSGVIEGHEGLLAEEVRGVNVGDIWATLSLDERARALGDLWKKAEAVHRVDLARVAPYVRAVSPFYAPTPAVAAAQVRTLEERATLTPAQSATLLAALDRFWNALPGAPTVLSHGDLCTENALWHQGRVSALLDFEFAVVATVELDANELLGAAYALGVGDDRSADPTDAGRRHLQDVVLHAVLPALARVGAKDRLLGYAVLLKLWATHKWLADGEGGESAINWQPHRELTALAAGDGGYLAPVLALLP